jgi:pyruvate/2-oxoglutarate dehydrogenase complex dihydrolipoamide dehydrogenase (E3) component
VRDRTAAGNRAAELGILPGHEHDRELISNVHPPDWVNPEPAGRYNLVVLGAGTAGLVTAAGAAGLGAKVALVERHLMGGDCLNVGCVPSKGVIRAGRAAAEIRRAGRFGIRVGDGVEIDFAAVMDRIRKERARISHADSARRFRELGVDVFLGEARFAGRDTVEVGNKRLRFKKAVIATGARPVIPPIPGIETAEVLTNETIFNLTERPDRLLVVGGGPIGVELSQAFARLGSRVAIVERMEQFLQREDPDATEILARAMKRDGVDVRLGTSVKAIEVAGAERIVHLEGEDGTESDLRVDRILMGVGRAPNVQGLNLETVGVEYDDRAGVEIDDGLRTTNRRIFAAGDVAIPYRFTHTADFSARIVIQNALFPGRKKLSALTVPWCTYTDPEVAHVGMYERDAEKAGIPVKTFKVPLSDVDRAILDGEDEGFVKIHVQAGTDRILGATIVASHAGEMISEISVAIDHGVGLGSLANVIHPYPTQAEAIRKAGDAYNRTRLTPGVKKLLERWLSWTR